MQGNPPASTRPTISRAEMEENSSLVLDRDHPPHSLAWCIFRIFKHTVPQKLPLRTRSG